MSKSYKVRLTQRGGCVAIADANGFFFASIISDNAGHYNLKVDDEKFLRNDLVQQLLQTVEIGNSYPVEYMVENAYFKVSERSF